MANGAFKFKDNSGNVVSFISGSGSDIIISGGTLDLSGMSGLTLGNVTLSGTTQNAVSTSHAASYLLTSSFNSYSGTTDTVIGSLQTSTSSLNTFTSSANSRLNSIEGVSGSYATTGSNIFIGTQTISGSVVPSVNNTYDLGSPTHQFRHIYISSGSLYIDGTKVLGSTSQELQITTDTGQSFKILEAGSDTITLQSADGNITLASSGGGDVILDPTSGIIALKGTTQIYAGNKVRSSDGNNIVFGDGLTVSGSVTITGFIEAQELRTTYISSSILYRSGSTKFGDELTDNHEFTGSVLISGSLSVPGSGLISGSSQIDVLSTTNIARIATTGSNTFTGNIGVGVSPNSSWSAQSKVIQVGSGSIYNDGLNNILVSNNTYYDGTNNIYINNGYATRYYQELSGGSHYFQVAPNGISGGAATYTSSLFISNNTNIGINKTSPNAQLDVNGATIISGSLTTTGNINVNSDGIRINRSSSGEPYIFFVKNGVTRASIYARDGAEGLRFFSAQNDFSGSVNVTGSFITNNLNGSLGYKTARFSSNDDVNGTRILIDNTGNTINYGLFVGGSSQGAGTDKFSIGTLNTDYTYISRSLVVLDATGSLGLGTQTPTNTLHILGRSDNQLKIDVASGGTFSSINFARNNVTNGVIGYNHNTNEFQVPYSNNASSYVVMYAGGAPKVTLKATGFMGVGTSDPQAKLHVDDGSVVVRTTPSTHSAYNWYSITDSHNTVRIKDSNELYIKKEVAGGSYGAFVLHPQTVGLNFDVTFDLTIGTPSSSYRHIAIAICSDGTNTTSNYDYIVLRHNVNDPSTNQIRIDVAGNTEQSYVSSAVPNFADGTQRRIQIRARNNFYVVEVDGSVIHSFMASARTRTSGKVGFAIYESTDANTYMYVRNFKIKDYSSERSVLYGWNTGEGLIGNKTQIRSNNSVTAMGRSYAHFPAPSANGAASIYLKNRRSYTKIQGYIRVRGGGSTDGWTNSGASISNDTFMDGIAITGFDSSGANETWIWGIVCNNYDANEYAVNKPSFVGSNYSTFLTNHSTINGLWLYTNDGSGRAPVRTFYFNRELGSALDGDIRIRIMSDQSPEDNEDVGIEEFGFNLIPANSNDFGNPENNKKLGEFIPAGTPIQVVAGSTTFSSGGSGNSVSLGTSCSGASPAWSCGIQIVSVKFTPKRANSLILIQTNNLAAWETSNASDHFYLFASNTEDGNVLVKSGMYLQNVGGTSGANGGIMCLNGSANSWGTTQKTISFRLGTTGSGSVYQYNPYYNAGGFDASTVGTFTYIITEIAQ